MSEKKQPDERVSIAARIPTPNGPTEQKLPTRIAVTGEFLGDANNNYETQTPVAVNRANVSRLAGLRPELHGVDVANRLTGEGTLLLEKVVFSRSPEHWPDEIIEQIPELKALRTLLEALYEAQRNPRLRKKLAEWLDNNPQIKAALQPSSN